MNSEEILKADVLDIIFENRNKQYGAYTLRKWYKNRLINALLIMVGIVTVLSAFTLIPKAKITDTGGLKVYDTFYGQIPTDPKKPELPRSTPKRQSLIVNTQKFISRIEIIKTDVLPKLNTLTETANIGEIDHNSKLNGLGRFTPEITGTGTGKDTVKTMTTTVPEVYSSPEIMPEFPGGVNALKRFLEKNLTNPRQLEEGEVISVKVKMVVGYDGKLQRFETIEDGGNEFNDEVIRVLKKMPNWIPGKTNGQNVSVYYTIPVKFIAAEP